MIEVDTKIQLGEEEGPLDYVHLKTDQLLQFGVEKVIWIFTDSKKVMIATADSPWLTQDWNLAVTVMPDVEVEIGALLL